MSDTALTAREVGLASLLFTVLTVVLAYPLSLHPSALRVDMGVDGDLGWWVLSWDTHAFLHRPWAIFDANIFYPDRYALAYGENVIGLAFFAAPIIWLTGDPPLATTLVSLLSAVLCGLGAYVLARRLGLSAAAAIVCGIVFECAPPRFFRLGQITLTNIQWIPFALASAHAYFDHGRKRDLRLTAAFVSLQVLSSGHGAVFVTLCLLLFGLYRLALGEPVRLLQRIRDLGVTGLLLLLPSVLIFYPYYRAQELAGVKRGLGSWDTEWASFLASPSHLHRWIYEQLHATRLLNAEVTLFPGLVAILLAGAAFAWHRERAPAADDAWRLRWQRIVTALELGAIGAALVWAVLSIGAAFNLRVGSLWIDQPTLARRLLATFVVALPSLLVIARLREPGSVRRLRGALAITGAAMLAAAALQAVRPSLGAGDGLDAQYFENVDASGPPAIETVDRLLSAPAMRRRWQGQLPERFTARWTGFLTVTRPGKYTFATTSDDGSQLFVDGNPTPVVDSPGPHSPLTRSGTIGLDRGSHQVELRYSQFGGGAMLDWTWSRDGSAEETVPLWAMSREPTTPGRATAVRILDWVHAVLAILSLAAATGALAAWRSAPARAALVSWADSHRGDARLFYLLLTLITTGLALGPPYGLWQYVYWMPLFNFIRASSRFTLVALLGLSVLAAFGVEAIVRRWPARKRNGFAAAAAVLLLAEYLAIPMGFTTTRYEIPAVDRWLDSQPKPFAIAEVPVHSEQDQVDYMNHSSAHWQRTVQGYHGWRPAFHTELNTVMEQFPDEASLDLLSSIGVRYVVMHQERYSPEERARVDAALERFAGRLRLEREEGSGRVFSIVPAPGHAAN